MIRHFLYITLLLSMFLSCRERENMVGPTIGTIDIVADESIKYLVEQEENVFEMTYKYATVNISYMTESDMMQKFMTDSTRAIMSTRPLTAEEVKFFEQKKSFPRQTVFATSALAFLVNNNVPDTAIQYEELISMFRDETKGKIFVIENAKSGISNEVMRLINTTSLPSHFYALNSKNEVIEYLQQHENAIGIVDWSDISDSDNKEAKELLGKTELVAISRPLDSIQHGFVRPYQYNLQDRKYPFTRDLYIITSTGKTDVSTGFASFVAGEIGQKIILKSGLLPIYQNERIIEIRNTADIKVIK